MLQMREMFLELLKNVNGFGPTGLNRILLVVRHKEWYVEVRGTDGWSANLRSQNEWLAGDFANCFVFEMMLLLLFGEEPTVSSVRRVFLIALP